MDQDFHYSVYRPRFRKDGSYSIDSLCIKRSLFRMENRRIVLSLHDNVISPAAPRQDTSVAPIPRRRLCMEGVKSRPKINYFKIGNGKVGYRNTNSFWDDIPRLSTREQNSYSLHQKRSHQMERFALRYAKISISPSVFVINLIIRQVIHNHTF
jgi:hypothetical protein